MENENEQISVDQLEDQLIDHPDALTKKLLDTSLDETFQCKLNARAEQITSQHNASEKANLLAGGNRMVNFGYGKDNNQLIPGFFNPSSSIENEYQFLMEKLRLTYEHQDYGTLEQEISEWFTYNDLKLLGIVSKDQSEMANEHYYINYSDIEESQIKNAVEQFPNYIDFLSENPSQLSEYMHLIMYFGLGNYKNCTTKDNQLTAMVQNCSRLYQWGLLENLLIYIEKFIDWRIESDQNSPSIISQHVQKNYFEALSLLYIMLNIHIHSPSSFPNIKETLASHDLISKVVKFIAHWKWKPNSTYRMRSLLLILWKLLLVELGDSDHLASVDAFLNEYHNISKDDDNKNKLKCSPLDYFTFREDVMSKYPLFDDKPRRKDDNYNFDDAHQILNSSNVVKDPHEFQTVKDYEYDNFMAINEYSNSLSNLLDIPKTNRSHSVYQQLPSQTVHIATPVPSPPSTPSDYMSGGEKIRKSYQLNQAMPFVYPISDDVKVPNAIKEADEILRNSIYESYSNKQLWAERQKFMRQERGFFSEYSDDHTEDEFNYNSSLLPKYPKYENQIKSLLRVEEIFSQALVHMNSLAEVLLGIIKSNDCDCDLSFAEWELNNNDEYILKKNSIEDISSSKVKYMVMQQLEVINVKEITLKATSSILVLLLKWFKMNHVLKYWYFSSVLFDQQYFSVLVDFLNTSIHSRNLQTNSSCSGSCENDKSSEFETRKYQNKILNPKINLPEFEFFNNCLKKFPEPQKYELINRTPFSKMASEADSSRINNILVNHFNSNFCFAAVNLLNVSDLILLENKTQRTLTLSDLKPSAIFKDLIKLNNEYMNKPILSMLKKLIPYQGRKWKSNNMDIISQIYLNSKLDLRDTWLSGRDLENDFNNSYGQEIALRGLLQFYNLRKYPLQMEKMGYQLDLEASEVFSFNMDE